MSFQSNRIVALVSTGLLLSTLIGCSSGPMKLRTVKAPPTTPKQQVPEVLKPKTEQAPLPEALPSIATPGAKALNKQRKKTNLSQLSNQKVAVLLPLSGTFEEAGLSVQKGLLKTYYDSNLTIPMLFFDTNSDTTPAIYEYVQEHFNVVIGPMLRKNIAKVTFNQDILNIPINQTDIRYNIFPIDASINAEAVQLTNEAFFQGHCRAIIIGMNTERGQQVTQAINANWTRLGGKTVDIVYLPSGRIIEATQMLKNVFSEPLNTVDSKNDDFPFARHDIDVILMSLPTQEARLVVPVTRLLGSNAPILSTSELTDSTQFNKSSEPDLIGIQFLDMPFRYDVADQANLLFNLGVDALSIADALSISSDFTYQGQTGRYTFQSIEEPFMVRKLNWYRFSSDSVKQVIPLPVLPLNVRTANAREADWHLLHSYHTNWTDGITPDSAPPPPTNAIPNQPFLQ